LLKTSVTDQVKIFPFKTNISASYHSENLITKEGNGKFALDLSNWFNHIIASNLSANNRALSYYPDFLFNDNYKYYFMFDKNVEVLNAEEFKTDIENSFGKLKITIKNVQPNIVLLESSFLVNKEEITSDEIADVATIYNAIKELNNRKLEFKIAQL